MKFADRTSFGPGASRYGEALEEARGRGGLLDLTLSNPTQSGFHFDADRLLAPLLNPAVLQYTAHPLGSAHAREAVSRHFREVYHAEVPPSRILLTASTSEAYGYLLRLFCEPGDAVLVPSPSYPLFDLLARLHDTELHTYPLVFHDGWQIDPASLAAAVTGRTRALVAIHPNNPTGHYCGAADRDALLSVAAERKMPLIIDEVFLDYAVEPREQPRSFASQWGTGRSSVLTFVMGGLSKLLALPQMKLAWTVVSGPEELVAEAMHRLEVIADTFLSVSTPPQVALQPWLAMREAIQGEILHRLRQNLAVLDRLLRGTHVTRLPVEGGWSAVLRIPAIEPDAEFAIRLLQNAAVAVHPGSFYGFPERGWFVISLLTPIAEFEEGVRRLIALTDG